MSPVALDELLLDAKLSVPKPRPGAVSRANLINPRLGDELEYLARFEGVERLFRQSGSLQRGLGHACEFEDRYDAHGTDLKKVPKRNPRKLISVSE